MTRDIKDIRLTSTIELCIINDIEIENEAIEVYEAHRCNECNSRFSSDDDKHVIAFSKRYKLSSATLVPLCRNCFKEITTSDIYHTFYQTPCHGFTDATHGNGVLVFQKSINKKESQKEEKMLSKYLIA
ncbi:hypothetical protein, partial [Peribacillus simplex]|uniref:hypothetical protein n=1 Tax=Peribacillus simplex TaxID=1478 RepID=UPI001E5E6887